MSAATVAQLLGKAGRYIGRASVLPAGFPKIIDARPQFLRRFTTHWRLSPYALGRTVHGPLFGNW